MGIRNHLVRIKNMASNSLPLPGARSPNCLTVEESKPFLRKEASKMRKLKQQEKRMVRMELQDQRKERKAQKQLFDDDFQEEMIRKKRSDDFPDDDYYDYENYPEYILTDEQNSLYRDEFYELYPEYLEIDEIDENEEPFGSDGIDLGGIPTKNIQRLRRSARGRRKKKKGKRGGKLGPKKVWFNLLTAARGFINENLKKCAERKTYIKRVGRLAERVKKNAPILTAPVKKCRGRKCRKNRG